MPGVDFPIAFAAGVTSFFAPCVIPLVPTYIAYIAGVSFSEIDGKNSFRIKRKIIFSGFFYILGFSLIFVVLGGAFGGLGIALRRYGDIIQRLGGLLIFIFGLNLAGLVSIRLTKRQGGLLLPEWSEKLGYFRSFLIGIIFATTWSPCIGPILGSILALATVSGTLTKGALLLFVYSLGISLPFIIFTLTLATLPKYLKFVSKHLGIVSKASGILLALFGLLLFTDTYKIVNGWVFTLAQRLGFGVR